MLKNLTIGKRLYLSTALIMLAFAGVVLVFKSTLTKTNGNYTHLLDSEVKISTLAREIAYEFEKSRKLEEAFLLERNDQTLIEHKKSIAHIAKLSEEIDALSEGMNEVKEQNSIVREMALSYDASFAYISDAWRKKGYNDKVIAGLQKKFTDIAADLMEKVKKHQIETLFISFMQIRQHEKDFYYLKEAMYKTRLDMAIVNFKYEIDNLDISKDQKAKYTNQINIYNDLIKEMVSSENAKKEEVYGKIGNQAEKIKNYIEQLYVPQVRTKILSIKRDELAYLLKGRESVLSVEEIYNLYHPEGASAEVQQGGSSGGCALFGDILEGDTSKKQEKVDKPAKKRSEMDNYEKVVDSLDLLVKAFRNLEDVMEEKHIKEIEIAVQNYKDLFSDLVKEDDMINYETNKLKEAALKFDDAVHKIVKITGESAEDKLGIIKSKAEETSNSAVLASTVVAALGFLIFFYITGTIVKPLNSAVDFAGHLASKNLNSDININTNDELAKLAGSLEVARDSLNESMKTISGKTNSLNDSSKSLSNASQNLGGAIGIVTEETNKTVKSTESMNQNLSEVDKNAGELKSNANKVLNNVRNVNENIESVTASVEEAQENISNIAAATEEMSATIDEIAESSEKNREVTRVAVNQTEEACKQVLEMTAAATEIEQIVDLIVEISDQTKNLSLNATIEAAR